MKTLKMIAVDIDGVLLNDTFSPVIKSVITKFNIKYTREIENNVFSQSREKAALYLIEQHRLPVPPEELITLYFSEREKYLKKNPVSACRGIRDFLEMLTGLHLPIICYGGLPDEHFYNNLGEYAHLFNRYICTNEFRPGIKEIIKLYDLESNQIVFIDDVFSVGRAAKSLDVPFIGIPSTAFQKQQMEENNFKYIFNALTSINKETLDEIDTLASLETFWQ